jgi:hypothetical protein
MPQHSEIRVFVFLLCAAICEMNEVTCYTEDEHICIQVPLIFLCFKSRVLKYLLTQNFSNGAQTPF